MAEAGGVGVGGAEPEGVGEGEPLAEREGAALPEPVARPVPLGAAPVALAQKVGDTEGEALPRALPL